MEQVVIYNIKEAIYKAENKFLIFLAVSHILPQNFEKWPKIINRFICTDTVKYPEEACNQRPLPHVETLLSSPVFENWNIYFIYLFV